MMRKLIPTTIIIAFITGWAITAHADGGQPTLEQLAAQIGKLQAQVAMLDARLKAANARIKSSEDKLDQLWTWASPLMDVLTWYDPDPNVDPYVEIQADVRTTGSASVEGLVVNGESTLNGQVYWLPWAQSNNKNPNYYTLSSVIYWAESLMPYLNMIYGGLGDYPTMRIQPYALVVKNKAVFEGHVIGTGLLDWWVGTKKGENVVMEVSNWLACLVQSENSGTSCIIPTHNP